MTVFFTNNITLLQIMGGSIASTCPRPLLKSNFSVATQSLQSLWITNRILKPEIMDEMDQQLSSGAPSILLFQKLFHLEKLRQKKTPQGLLALGEKWSFLGKKGSFLGKVGRSFRRRWVQSDALGRTSHCRLCNDLGQEKEGHGDKEKLSIPTFGSKITVSFCLAFSS